MYKKILDLAQKRIETFEAGDKPEFYQGSSTYLNCLKQEIQEMEIELQEDNIPYLEDELGDVLWVYICLLESLKAEGKITGIEKVLQRSYKKFSERISPISGKNRENWEVTKKKQKAELAAEHKKLYT